MSMSKELPAEIEADILSRVDVKTLMRLRTVCKRWLVLISNPKFVKLHLQRSISAKRKNILLTMATPKFRIIDLVGLSLVRDVKIPLLDNNTRAYDVVEVVGTCDGLLCLLLKNEHSDIPNIVIYNPSTGIFNGLPAPLDQIEESMSFYWGFGYDSSIDDYKVVLGVNLNKRTTKFKVLNLKDNHWRTIFDESGTTDRAAKDSIFGQPKSGFAEFINGDLHWFGFPGGVDVSTKQKRIEGTVCFDLSEETFKELPSVELPLVEDVHWIDSFGVLGGCIWVIYCVALHELQLELWIKHSDAGSWIKRFDVSMEKYDSIKPICFLGNGELLLEVYTGRRYDLGVHAFGHIHRVAKRCRSGLFVESLVSPHGNTR